MGKGPRWSGVEEEFLIECVNQDKDKFKIAEEFYIRTKMNIKGFHKRTPDAIQRRIYDLPDDQQPVDESKPAMHRKTWSLEDDDMLKHYKSMGMSYGEMADQLNRTESAIESRLQVLKNKHSTWTGIWNWLSGLGMSINKLFSREGGK